MKISQVLLTLKGDPVLVLDGRAEDGAGITTLGFAGVTFKSVFSEKLFHCLDNQYDLKFTDSYHGVLFVGLWLERHPGVEPLDTL